MIAAAQFGITVCSLGLGAVAEPALAHLIEPLAELVHLPDGWLHPVAFAIATDLRGLPARRARRDGARRTSRSPGPERAAMVLGPPMVAMVTVLKPIVRGLDAVANGVVRSLRIEPRTEVVSTFTLEEVEAMVDESRHEGMLDESEYDRLSGALGFTSRTVAEVLLPLDRLETVQRGARASDVELNCAETGYSRFPVVGADGELTGYLHIKDVLQADPHGRARVVEDEVGAPARQRRASTTPWSARCRRCRPRARTWRAWSTTRARCSASPPSRTSSRSWSARSATRRTPRVAERRRNSGAARQGPPGAACNARVQSAECSAGGALRGTTPRYMRSAPPPPGRGRRRGRGTPRCAAARPRRP